MANSAGEAEKQNSACFDCFNEFRGCHRRRPKRWFRSRAVGDADDRRGCCPSHYFYRYQLDLCL